MKCRIIRLAGNAFSMRISQDCIQAAEKFGLDIQPFDGLYPDQAQKFFDRFGIKKHPAKLKKDSPGILGCAASHFSLWQQCRDDDVPYMILEQDAYMIRPMPINLVFDDVLKLDSCNPFDASYDACVAVEKEQGICDYDVNWGYKVKAAPYGGYFLGAWSYIIKPHAADKLIQAFHTNGWVPADKQFGSHLLHLETVQQTVFRIHPEYTSENIQRLSLTRNLPSIAAC